MSLRYARLSRIEASLATLAWTYFASRVVHTLVQATINKIEVRFAIFVLSSLILIALTINAARAVF